MKPQEIIALAEQIKNEFNTSDPFEIARQMGIHITMLNSGKGFRAFTIKIPSYPDVIMINNEYSEISKKILCAHELGHVLLHEDAVNHFAVTEKNIYTSVEYEANLFAVALLLNQDEVDMPFDNMTNAILKSILDLNIYT